MDDYTWRKKLQERQRRVKRERFFFLLFLVASLGALLWYFGVYARTPEYAAKQIEQALEEKDLPTFQQYTALDLLLSDAYDDLTVDLFHNDNTLSPQTKALFEKFYVLVKPQLTHATAEAVYHRISTGGWIMPEGTDMLKGRQLGIDFEEFLERSLLRHTVIQRFGEIARADDAVTLRLHVMEERTRTPFTLELGMEKNEDRVWQVTSIRNYRSYLETVSPRIYQDIAQYIADTADIVARYNESLQAHQWTVQYLSYSSGGRLGKGQRTELSSYLEDRVIPEIKKRQEELDQVEARPGAEYLAELRSESTDLSIRVWQHYIHALREDNIAEYNTAESLHKQMLAVEQRIEDIVRHAAVANTVPDMP